MRTTSGRQIKRYPAASQRSATPGHLRNINFLMRNINQLLRNINFLLFKRMRGSARGWT